MKKLLFIVAVLCFVSCTKETELIAKPGRGGVNVRIDQINFADKDHPLTSAFFSVYLDNVQKQVTFSTKHTETQTLTTFVASTGQTIHLNIDADKATQLGYVPTFRVICDLDTAIIYLNASTTHIVP